MVCLSGGKDSYTMLDMLLHVQKAAPINFEIIAVNLDQKQPDYPEHILPNYLEEIGVNYKIIEKDTYSVVMEKTPEGKTLCTLCSRLRRGTLYAAAKDLGCNKIALGHHRNDILETFFLNFFFAGKIETMPPKFRNDAGDLIVLRPLAFCDEEDIIKYSEEKALELIADYYEFYNADEEYDNPVVRQISNNVFYVKVEYCTGGKDTCYKSDYNGGTIKHDFFWSSKVLVLKIQSSTKYTVTVKDDF